MAERPVLPDTILQALRAYQPERAILFGSAARGDADAMSDLDLILIKKTPQPFVARGVEFVRLLPSGAPRVDVFVYTPEEFARMRAYESPFLETALRDGVTVYEASTGRT